MDTVKLNDLYNKMMQVHEKATDVFNNASTSSMLKNEFNNKVSQYDGMYDSVVTMKEMSSKPETIDNLTSQQIEILNVRIKWELDWMSRTIKTF